MIFPGFSVPGRHKVRVNVVAVVTEKLLPLCHQPGGEDAHDLSPPGVLHLTIPARGTNKHLSSQVWLIYLQFGVKLWLTLWPRLAL